MDKNNRVATILKVYAWLNFFVSLFLLGVLQDELYLSGISFWVLIGVSAVVNFGIYALGEIVQILHDIRNNLISSNKQISATASIEEELPNI